MFIVEAPDKLFFSRMLNAVSGVGVQQAGLENALQSISDIGVAKARKTFEKSRVICVRSFSKASGICRARQLP